jgi:peptidoglycan hydrolase CwlO-like protein
MLSSSEISNIQDEKEKELQKAIDNLSTVEQEILLLRRKIIDLQGKRTDLEFSKSKASQNVRVLQSELRTLKNQFWSARNSGL